MKIGAVMSASRRWEIEFQKYFWWNASGRETKAAIVKRPAEADCVGAT